MLVAGSPRSLRDTFSLEDDLSAGYTVESARYTIYALRFVPRSDYAYQASVFQYADDRIARCRRAEGRSVKSKLRECRPGSRKSGRRR